MKNNTEMPISGEWLPERGPDVRPSYEVDFNEETFICEERSTCFKADQGERDVKQEMKADETIPPEEVIRFEMVDETCIVH